MKKSFVKDKSFVFALKVIKIYKSLIGDQREFVISKQLLRSGSSIGALVRESEHAESKVDFIHKLSIALKEANETEYWLDLLFHSDYLSREDFESFQTDNKEILRLLISIIKTSKGK